MLASCRVVELDGPCVILLRSHSQPDPHLDTSSTPIAPWLLTAQSSGNERAPSDQLAVTRTCGRRIW